MCKATTVALYACAFDTPTNEGGAKITTVVRQTLERSKFLSTSWVRAAPHLLKANLLTGLAPLSPFKSIQITQKNFKNKFDYFFSCAKGAAKGFCRPSWAILGKVGFFELFQNYTSPGGGQPKKVF